jgi:UDP:flavonoid glycosyltransferase YjiC (YdhE family)
VNNPDLLASLPVTMLPPADSIPFLFSGRSIREVPWHQRFTAPLVRKLAAAATSLTVDREHNALRKTRKLPPISAHRLLSGRPILVNGVFGLEYARPLPPLVEMIGPMLAASVPPLPAELSQWLSNGPPVVYANLGTLVVAPKEQLAKMIEAFNTDRSRTLWILKPQQAAALPLPLPASLRILNWGPMPVAVLQHSNVRAFVSHCGINSVHESMSTRTPMVGIPMFADQRDMAVRVADAGAGLWLDKTRFTANDLRAAIERVLNDLSFERNAANVQAAIAASGGTRRAADLIEQAAEEAI